MGVPGHSPVGGRKGDWWRAYDSRFRQQVPSLEKAEFGRLDQALYTRCLLSSGPGGALRWPSDSGPTSRPKRRRVIACFTWNDGRPCAVIPCRFQHICSRCGGEHHALPWKKGRERHPTYKLPSVWGLFN